MHDQRRMHHAPIISCVLPPLMPAAPPELLPPVRDHVTSARKQPKPGPDKPTAVLRAIGAGSGSQRARNEPATEPKGDPQNIADELTAVPHVVRSSHARACPLGERRRGGGGEGSASARGAGASPDR